MIPVVLLVEDSADLAALVAVTLEGVADVVVAGDLASARARLVAPPSVAAVVCDLGLPDASGDEAVAALCVARPDVPLVVLTGTPDPVVAAAAARAGAMRVLPKSAILDGELVAVVAAVIGHDAG